MMGRSTLRALALTIALASGTPALAANAPQTRLVECGAQSCLVITGSRDAVDSSVTINGQTVKTYGGRRWRVRMPVEAVRSLSAPYARTISVAVDGAKKEAKLPVGMMGHADLAMLVVRVK
jgi:hypothetical protein